MSSLPTRTDISGTPTNATAKSALSSIYDFIAQRFAAGTSGAGAATAAELQTSRESLGVGSIGTRNVLINPAMVIDQRNAGAAQTLTAGAALAYTVDRWYAYCTGANVTGQQIASGAQKRYRFTGAASVTAVGFGQRIEAANSLHLAGLSTTLQIKAASSSLTTLNWAAYYANSADTFGTLASPTRTSIASGSFTISSTESTYLTQISIPGAATTGIEIVFTAGALLAGQTLTLGDVQLEQGSMTVAPLFERRPIGMELALCQRYFEKSYSQADSPGTAGANGYEYWYNAQTGASAGIKVTYKVNKRSSPTTLTTYSSATGAAGNIRNITGAADVASTTISNGEHGFVLQTNAAGALAFYAAHWAVSSEL